MNVRHTNEGGDFCDVVLKYINQVLMEDDLDENANVIEDSTLYAAEKSFYEVLNYKDPSLPTSHSPRNQDKTSCTGTSSSDSGLSTSCFNACSSAESNHSVESPFSAPKFDSSSDPVFGFDGLFQIVPPKHQSCLLSNGLIEDSQSFRTSEDGGNFARTQKALLKGEEDVPQKGKDERGLTKLPMARKGLSRDESDLEERRSAKCVEVETDESVLYEMFDRVLSLYGSKDASTDEASSDWKRIELAQEFDFEKTYMRRGATKREAIDMRSLLIKCMEFVAANDHDSAYKKLTEIRLRSSPVGDGSQRLAHYFANGLEARLMGAESPVTKPLAIKSIPDSEVLKSYRVYLSAFPFMESSYQFSAHTIMELAQEATSIHIIHFGIVYGAQWLPLIHSLSARPGGPPKLRITGIDFPQSGFRPDARVKETGRRLANYCERFNVPFQYSGIAKKWETINVKDLKIQSGEVLVVNCFYQFMYLPDETITRDSPRDTVLRLINAMKPDIFIQGISNGTHNSPFFVSRFREALFHFSALFDMMEAVVPRENQMRMVYEREIWGNEILNTVACEGFERIERPETYKQWQIRTLRAGFKQLPLKQELLKELRAKVKSSYHKDFFVDEASQWLVEGWKGRVIFAFSCWKPA